MLQQDTPSGEPAPDILESRIWIDGCWDFFHHGHAGAMLQARQLGAELYVGVHSDEAILDNKGPTVMSLAERTSAVDACRWVTFSVPRAPYVTALEWISHYGCKFVVHGDDITSDSGGEDCYRFVKAAGRFQVVKRTPSISTTDLVGRMLLYTRSHFIKSLSKVLEGMEGSGNLEERKSLGSTMMETIRMYATDSTGLSPGPSVWLWTGDTEDSTETQGFHRSICKGSRPLHGQRVVYVDGGFDLFSSGHIEFLKHVIRAENKIATSLGWYTREAVRSRLTKGGDYAPAFIVAGIHDDEVINHWKGINYPIMNIYERGLCVLQCKYVDSVIFGAPFTPTQEYLSAIPWDTLDAVYHGPTNFMPLTYDPYIAPKAMGIYKEIGDHEFSGVNASQIVQRILASREMYEERQRKKKLKHNREQEHDEV